MPIATDSPRSLARDVALPATVWFVCSAALLLFRPGYLFPPFELLDSWIYTSYQWAPRAQISDFGATYYGSRLSWILPGALIQHYLPPVPAEILFKLGVSAVLATAVGMIVHRGHGSRWAAIGVAATVCCPAVIQALHADYIDTPVFTYGALTAASITWSRDSQWWPLWIGAAGASLMLMLAANLGALSSIGVALGVFHLVWLRWSIRRHVACLPIYLVGAAVVFCAIGAMHQHLGGPFYFIKPQVDMVLFFKQTKTNPWAPTDPRWFLAAHWLILPFASLVWGLYCSVFDEGKDPRAKALLRAVTAALATSLGLALLVELRRTASVLSLYYYTSFHLVFALPLLTLCCASCFRSPLRLWPLVALALALLMIPLAIAPPETWRCLAPVFSLLPRPEWFAVSVSITLLLPVAFIAGWLSRKLPGTRAALAAAAPLALMLFSHSPGLHGPEISSHLRERYQSVHDAYFAIERRFPRGTIRYWVDGAWRNGVSLASTKLWGYRLLTIKGFPEFSTETMSAVGTTIIVPLSPGAYGNALEKAEAALKPWGLEASRPELIRLPGQAGMGFDLLCFELTVRPIDPEEPRPANAPVLNMLAGFEYFSPNRYTDVINYLRHDAAAAWPVVDTTGHYPIFQRTAPDDLVATHFRTFPEIPYGKFRHLMIVTVMPATGHCTLVFQDESFRELGRFTLEASGRSVHAIGVPTDAKTYRVCFVSSRDESTPLPVNVNVYELVR